MLVIYCCLQNVLQPNCYLIYINHILSLTECTLLNCCIIYISYIVSFSKFTWSNCYIIHSVSRKVYLTDPIYIIRIIVWKVHQQNWQTPYKAKHSVWIRLNSVEFAVEFGWIPDAFRWIWEPFLYLTLNFRTSKMHQEFNGIQLECTEFNGIQRNSMEFNWIQPNSLNALLFQSCWRMFYQYKIRVRIRVRIRVKIRVRMIVRMRTEMKVGIRKGIGIQIKTKLLI